MSNITLKGNSKRGLTGATIVFFIGFAAVFKIVRNAVPQAIGGAAGWIGGLGGFIIPPIMASFLNSSDLSGFPKGFSIFIVLIIVSILIPVFFKKATKAK